jgi:hypothetical protein
MTDDFTDLEKRLRQAEEERDEARADYTKLCERRSRAAGGKIGDLLDNQAWIMFSHVASRLKSGNDCLMEEWQDAWADGEVQRGFFSSHRGAAAWIARECNALIDAAEARAEAASELSRLRSQVEEMSQVLGTCAWQLEMLSTEWASQIPGAIAVQCGVKAAMARQALKGQSQ